MNKIIPYLTTLFFAALAYFQPIKDIIHFVLLCLTIDLLSGVWVSYKFKTSKIKSIAKTKFFVRRLLMVIESGKLRQTIVKMVWYTMAVILAFLMQKVFSLDWANFSQITGGFICFIEIKSIFENIAKITENPVFLKILKLFTNKANEVYKTDGTEEPKK